VAGGVLKPGDEVAVLPSGVTSTISKVELFDQKITEAFRPCRSRSTSTTT